MALDVSSLKINTGNLTLASPDFEHGGRLPYAQSLEGGVAPALEWSGAPAGTKSYALVMHDPDAPVLGGFIHWVVYNIAGSKAGLRPGDTGHEVGPNGLGERAWRPVTPLPGHGEHYYFFHLYALDIEPSLPKGLDAEKLYRLIERPILVQARLVGTYRNDDTA